MGKHGARSIGWSLRCPRTQQEKKMNDAHIEYVRGKRRPNRLPDAWDDINSEGLYRRSWKDRFKKRYQWDKKPLKRTRFYSSWSWNRWYRGFVIREHGTSNGDAFIQICEEGSKFPILEYKYERNRYWKNYINACEIIDNLIDKGVGYVGR